MEFKYCKLEIFIPETKILELQKALQKVDAGHIGNYDSCMSVSQVTGYWRPLDGTDPYIGKAGVYWREWENKQRAGGKSRSDNLCRSGRADDSGNQGSASV